MSGMNKDAVDRSIREWLKEKPELDISGLEVEMWIIRVARLIDLRFGSLCKREFGLLPSEARTLLVLRRSGRPYALRPTDLFRAQLVTSGATTKQVNRLCSLELVVRNRDPLHAGGYLVQLTAKGVKTADKLVKTMVRAGGPAAQIAAEWHALPADKVQAIRQFMARVLDISEGAADADGKSA